MKSTYSSILLALFAERAASHATFQDLWVNGVDYGAQCVRLPQSNNPVTAVSSNDVVCNASPSSAKGKCPVAAGDTVTVEMHQQPGDRSCSNEAIGGDHHGPVIVYMSKVSDSASASGTDSGWFKVFEDGWAKNPSGSNGDADFWGTKDMNGCCGLVDVKIPSDIAAGDYLLRAEVIALHVAGSSGGAQLYMSCYQLTLTDGGSASPDTVKFPGAYSASDPGILVDIHAALDTYVVPGPTVYSGGSTKSAGSGCDGCEATCTAGSSPATTIPGTSTPTSGGGNDGSDGGSGCTAAAYEQCGGTGFSGCTTCASGSTCVAVSAPYYSQCQPSS